MSQPLDLPIRISPDVLSQEVQGEIVLLHLGNESYFGLDALGTRIWLWLKDGLTLPEIQAQILQEYQVEPEPLARDLRALVDELIRAGLVSAAAPENTAAE